MKRQDLVGENARWRRTVKKVRQGAPILRDKTCTVNAAESPIPAFTGKDNAQTTVAGCTKRPVS